MIEVLVVFGIIALMSAILIPIFSNVKESARRVTCASNLRQIGFSLKAYLQDSQGRYPPTQEYGTNCVWGHRLLKYVKGGQIFECPSYPQGAFAPACSAGNLEEDPPQWFNGGYQWNNVRVRGRQLTESDIRRPSELVIISDGSADHSATMTPATSSMFSTIDDLKYSGLGARHKQGVNVLYTDSHVKWLPLEQLLNRNIWKVG